MPPVPVPPSSPAPLLPLPPLLLLPLPPLLLLPLLPLLDPLLLEVWPLRSLPELAPEPLLLDETPR
jgi:hypothetical protein